MGQPTSPEKNSLLAALGIQNKNSQFKNRNPENALAIKDATQKRIQAAKLLQEAEQGINRGTNLVEIRVAHNDPIQIVLLGDLHYGSRATDYDELKKIVDYIQNQPNVGVVLMGDLIEGAKPAYFATNGARTPLTVTEMIVDIVDILKPLADDGKILAQVTDFFGHEGWTETEAGINANYVLNRFLNEGLPENQQVLMVNQHEGHLAIEFLHGHRQVFDLQHIPGSNSKVDPLYGLEKKAEQYPTESMPHGMWAGHNHRAAIGVTNYPDTMVTFSQIGTIKGNTYPDRLGELANLGTVSNLEQGLVIAPRRKHHPTNVRRTYPTHNPIVAQKIQEALTVRDKLESQGIFSEIAEHANQQAQEQPLTVKFNSRSSRQTRTQHNEKVDKQESPAVESLSKYGYSQQYRELVFELGNTLGAPILLQFLSNTRFGSNSANPQEVWDGYIEPAIQDPYRLVLPGRQIIDQDVSKRPDRMQVLQETAELLKSIKDQIPFTFLDGALRAEQWKKTLRKNGPETGPIPAGSTLGNLIHGEDSRLAENQSRLKFWIDTPHGKQLIQGVVVDKLGNHASYNRATYGLSAMYNSRKLPLESDFVYGGHTPLSGYTVWEKPKQEGYVIFVAPGWPTSQANPRGKSNLQYGSSAGLAIIYDPATKALYPTANYFQTEELYGAMKVENFIQRNSNGNPEKFLKRTDRPATKNKTRRRRPRQNTR